MASRLSFKSWLEWLQPTRKGQEQKFLLEWPYRDAEFVTEEIAWSSYVHEHRMRWLRELELQQCAKRLKEQRAEINRLLGENKHLKELLSKSGTPIVPILTQEIPPPL